MKKAGQRFWVVIGVLVLMAVPSIHPAGAKDPDYPTRPVTLYIGFGAGGALDLAARGFAEPAGKYLGQPFVCVNKAGASGSLTGLAVRDAQPDGYTLGIVSVANAYIAPYSDKAPYKDLSDFTMLVNFGGSCFPLLVRSDAPWKNWKELMEWVRKNPRGVKIGISGAKTVASSGFALRQVEVKEQVEFTYIPFPGTSDILTATLGGHVAVFGGGSSPTVLEYIKEGKLRILTYLGVRKLKGYENVPSLPETYGLFTPDLNGIFGPKGLPNYAVKRLDEAFAVAVKDPGFLNVINRIGGWDVVYMDRAKMNTYVNETFPKFGEIMKMLKAEEAKRQK